MRGKCSGAGEDGGRPGPHGRAQVPQGADNLGRGKGGPAGGRRSGGMSSGESEPVSWLGHFLRPEGLEWASPLGFCLFPGLCRPPSSPPMSVA